MAKDLYRLIVLVNLDGEFSENVLTFEASKTASSTPGADAQNLIAGWIANLESFYADAIPISASIIGYKAKRINNGGGPTITVPQVGVSGSRTGALGNTATSPCVTFPIASGARYVTGKIFIPGVTITDCVANHLQAGIISAIGNFASVLLTSFIDGGITFEFVIFSQKLKVSLGPPTSSSRAATVGIQRRRRLPAM